MLIDHDIWRSPRERNNISNISRTEWFQNINNWLMKRFIPHGHFD